MEKYNFSINDFDVELLLSGNEKIIASTNFNTITSLCSDVKKYSNMVAIIGEPGYGKTLSLKYFSDRNENVYYINVKKTMTAKIFYSEILNNIGFANKHGQDNIYYIIESIAHYLNENKQKNLLVIDEAGKLSHNHLLYLHDLRDSISKSTGIVIAGPKYFQNDITNQLKLNKIGIPELYRRINTWIELDLPSYNEKFQLCKFSGIKNDNLINAICKDIQYKTLSDISNLIKSFQIIIDRQSNYEEK